MVKTAFFVRSRSRFVVLLFICSLVISMFAPVRPESKRSWGNTSYARLSYPASSGNSVSHKKAAAGSGHLKVRYVGGDCSFDRGFSIDAHTNQYNTLVASCHPLSLILPRAHFFFKLRGPPIATAGTMRMRLCQI